MPDHHKGVGALPHLVIYWVSNREQLTASHSNELQLTRSAPLVSAGARLSQLRDRP